MDESTLRFIRHNEVALLKRRGDNINPDNMGIESSRRIDRTQGVNGRRRSSNGVTYDELKTDPSRTSAI